MSTLHFSDGMSVDTSGPLRVVELLDGWYVIGQGMLCPCTDEADCEALMDELQGRIVTVEEDGDE